MIQTRLLDRELFQREPPMIRSDFQQSRQRIEVPTFSEVTHLQRAVTGEKSGISARKKGGRSLPVFLDESLAQCIRHSFRRTDH